MDTEALTPVLGFENRPQGERVFSMALVSVPAMDEFRSEIWCYEMADGTGEGQVQEDGSLIIRHTMGTVAVTTTLTPEPGAVRLRVEATGADPGAVRRLRSVNACWQLRASDGFGNRGAFFEDFVSRCFVFTIRGFTSMSETNRFPDTRWDRYSATPERNDPPWVQVYVPVWRRHGGQPDAFWGSSSDRPIHSLVGCVSRDGRWITAWGWPRCSALSQGWHDCLHATPDFGGCYDPLTNTTTCEGRLYFMTNHPKALLARYLADFPQEPAQVEIVQEDGRLRVRHVEAGVAAGGPALRVSTAQETYWGGWRAESGEGAIRATWWLYPYEESVLIAARATNQGDRPGSMPPGFATGAQPYGDGWAYGVALEDHGLILPGTSTTVRGIVRITRGTVREVQELLAEDEAEWERSGPYEIPGRSHTADVLSRRQTQ
ncbi:MAG: hypothetical protein AB7Y46_02565 [Armatimonadota bacterium]